MQCPFALRIAKTIDLMCIWSILVYKFAHHLFKQLWFVVHTLFGDFLFLIRKNSKCRVRVGQPQDSGALQMELAKYSRPRDSSVCSIQGSTSYL